MVGPGDFVPVVFQAVLFTPDEGLSVPRLIRDLAPKWSRFDVPPTQIPELPGNVFAEVPRAVLRSGDERWQFEAAQARSAVVCRETDGAPFPVKLEEALAEAASMFVEYRNAFKTRVGRVAAVITRVAFADDPGVQLARHFCAERWWKGQPLNRPASFEIHSHKRYDIRDWGAVNSWVRVKTGTRTFDGEQRPVVAIEQDINSLAEDLPSKDISDDELRAFFSVVGREFNEILALYFPGEAR